MGHHRPAVNVGAHHIETPLSTANAFSLVLRRHEPEKALLKADRALLIDGYAKTFSQRLRSRKKERIRPVQTNACINMALT